jgi:hypothetical protein
MTAPLYIVQIGVSDSTVGGDIIEVRMQYINTYQLFIIIGTLQNMLHRFKQTAESYYSIIIDTINDMNLLLSEVEGNTVFCSISRNLQSHHAEAFTDEWIGSLDEDTMDATIDSEVPMYVLDSESLGPFLYTVNQRRIFSYGVQSASDPNWTEILRELEWSA